MYYTLQNGFTQSKYTNLYQTNQLWWEMYNRDCGECLTDAKSEGVGSGKL